MPKSFSRVTFVFCRCFSLFHHQHFYQLNHLPVLQLCKKETARSVQGVEHRGKRHKSHCNNHKFKDKFWDSVFEIGKLYSRFDESSPRRIARAQFTEIEFTYKKKFETISEIKMGFRGDGEATGYKHTSFSIFSNIPPSFMEQSITDTRLNIITTSISISE